MEDSGYYQGVQDDADVEAAKRHQALYLIGLVLLVVVCIIIIWVCIMLACYIPGFLKKTLEAWLNSSSMMKRRVAATITRTPFEATGPERERNWEARRQTNVAENHTTNGGVF
uniref:MP n=1 Tax=Milk vetch dwarf virus TaxID=67585 RepID=A0A6M2YZ33_9VIRU|nr:MP [Milk vetch dwarf virus]UVC58077.1 movement protein [Milk vetch dwarf virus]UVC58078.1 movement protein [Milk vetch dwarf virus]